MTHELEVRGHLITVQTQAVDDFYVARCEELDFSQAGDTEGGAVRALASLLETHYAREERLASLAYALP